jgi:thiamine-phosphate pyrophosphorylase
MADADNSRCRLCLVTPETNDLAGLRPLVDAALAGGDVACLIVTGSPESLQEIAEGLAPVAQSRDVAALVHNDTRIAGRAKADGVHVDTGPADLRIAMDTLRPAKIVGAGGLRSRHDAMLAGEANPDYLFFGRLDGDTRESIFPKALDLASWWSSIFLIPAMVMGGRSLASASEAAGAGVEFVALRDAVWSHAAGPGEAVATANRLLAKAPERAA